MVLTRTYDTVERSLVPEPRRYREMRSKNLVWSPDGSQIQWLDVRRTRRN